MIQAGNLDRPLLAPNGLIVLVDLFTNPQKKKKLRREQQIQIMYNLIEQKKNDQIVKQNLDKVSKFINTYFLLNFLETSIMIPQFQHSISDRKLITVIFTAYRIVYIDEFINNSLWRQKALQNFIKKLRQFQQQMTKELIKTRISNQDLQHLFSLNQLMATPQNKRYVAPPTNSQAYNVIKQCLQQKADLNPKVTSNLFKNTIDCLYLYIGTIQTNKNLQMQKIKLCILYVRCATLLKQQKLSNQSSRSKIKYILNYKGYQTLVYYFNDVSFNAIKNDKQFCRQLFLHSAIMERNLSSQQSSEKQQSNEILGKNIKQDENMRQKKVKQGW